VQFSSVIKKTYVVYREMNASGNHHVKQNKPHRNISNSCFLSYVEPRKRKKDMKVNGGTLGRVEG
jgi:hypothetical protein